MRPAHSAALGQDCIQAPSRAGPPALEHLGHGCIQPGRVWEWRLATSVTLPYGLCGVVFVLFLCLGFFHGGPPGLFLLPGRGQLGFRRSLGAGAGLGSGLGSGLGAGLGSGCGRGFAHGDQHVDQAAIGAYSADEGQGIEAGGADRAPVPGGLQLLVAVLVIADGAVLVVFIGCLLYTSNVDGVQETVTLDFSLDGDGKITFVKLAAA